jgi:hypothetical protein
VNKASPGLDWPGPLAILVHLARTPCLNSVQTAERVNTTSSQLWQRHSDRCCANAIAPVAACRPYQTLVIEPLQSRNDAAHVSPLSLRVVVSMRSRYFPLAPRSISHHRVVLCSSLSATADVPCHRASSTRASYTASATPSSSVGRLRRVVKAATSVRVSEALCLKNADGGAEHCCHLLPPAGEVLTTSSPLCHNTSRAPPCRVASDSPHFPSRRSSESQPKQPRRFAPSRRAPHKH